MGNIDSTLTNIIINILAGILLFIAGFFIKQLYDFFYKRRPLYRIWGFENKNEEICVVTGNIEHEMYKHLMASGDIRAYGEVMSTLRNNYKKDLINSFFSKEFHPSQLMKYNIISVGGPRWNWVTRKVLDGFGDPFIFDLDNKCLIDRRVKPEKKYSVVIKEDEGVKEDYGIIIKAINPHKNDRNILIFMGYTTYGVLAATRCLSDLHEYILRRKEIKNKFLKTKYFSVIVMAKIIKDEIGEEEVVPEIIEDSFLEMDVKK